MSTTQTLEEMLAQAAATAQIPHQGPDQTFGGLGADAEWADVYNAIEAIAHKTREDVEAQLGTDGQFISLEIQAYVGALLRVVSTYINNIYTTFIDQTVSFWNTIQFVQDDLQQQIDRQDQLLTALITSNYEVREGIIPALLQQMETQQEEEQKRALVLEGQMQQWTEDNIYKPLVLQQQLLDQQTREREIVLAQQQYHYTDDQVQKEEWERVAAVLIAQQQLNVIEQEFETCVNGMCETQGPGTPVGKFLKALALASDAALIYELANLDEAGVQSLLRGFQSLSGGIIDTFENVFVGGGGSLLDVATSAI